MMLALIVPSSVTKSIFQGNVAYTGLLERSSGRKKRADAIFIFICVLVMAVLVSVINSK